MGTWLFEPVTPPQCFARGTREGPKALQQAPSLRGGEVPNWWS